MKRIAIIGGGPIGVEAALYGCAVGFDVALFERGNIADNVRRWGFVQVFTEWRRNRSPLAVRLLTDAGFNLPPDETYSSGEALADYVEKLSQLPLLQGRVFTQTEVLSVTRARCLKSDFLGSDGLSAQEVRAEFPFRLVLRHRGREWAETFDGVIDATGVYASPNWMGNGGAPCPGEQSCARYIDYALPDVLGRERARFANKHTLVVGSGHSAASTLLSVAELMEEFAATRLSWIVRRDVPPHGAPYTLVPNETSTTRARIHKRANALIGHPNVRFLPRTVVDEVRHENGVFHVSAQRAESNGLHVNEIVCDNIAAHTGFRVDTKLWEELQVRLHPGTGAPLALGTELNQHNARSGVGLSTGYAEKQPREEEAEHNARDRWNFLINDPALLHSGEANFYILGIKSYGRDAGFLMHNGFRQVRDVWRLISGEAGLDLYEGRL
jgi:hypothetical protein